MSAGEVATGELGAGPEAAPRRKRKVGIRLNLPNLLTLGRVAVVPVLVGLMWCAPSSPGKDGGLWYTLAMLLCLAGSITDAVDGHLARTRKEVTRFGRFTDPVADKLMAVAVFVLLVEKQAIPGWVVTVILGREFAVMALRMILAADGISVVVSRWAKIKTILQMVAMVTVLIRLSLAELSGGGWVSLPVSVVVYFGYIAWASVYVAALLTVATGVQYFSSNWAHLGSETGA